MNIFWNVKTLDNKRLNKQILELSQIGRAIAWNLGNRSDKMPGYINHPVVKFYERNVTSYCEAINIFGREYFNRFGKFHALTLDICAFYFKEISPHILNFNIGFKKRCFVAKSAPFYIKFICYITDFFSTPLAYWIYCKFYKWRKDNE